MSDTEDLNTNPEEVITQEVSNETADDPAILDIDIKTQVREEAQKVLDVIDQVGEAIDVMKEHIEIIPRDLTGPKLPPIKLTTIQNRPDTTDTTDSIAVILMYLCLFGGAVAMLGVAVTTVGDCPANEFTSCLHERFFAIAPECAANGTIPLNSSDLYTPLAMKFAPKYQIIAHESSIVNGIIRAWIRRTTDPYSKPRLVTYHRVRGGIFDFGCLVKSKHTE